MKHRSNLLNFTFIMLAVLSIATACGDKKKDDDSGPGKPTVEIGQVQDAGNGGVFITFKADQNDAEFQCQETLNGQAIQNWYDCDGSAFVNVQGQGHIFSVKAIATDGTESDAESINLSNFSGGAQASNVQVIIKEKEDGTVGSTYNRTTLRVTFEARDGQGNTLSNDQISFECKVDDDWTACKDAQGRNDAYEFETLNSGSEYQLLVRANVNGTKGPVTELKFRVDVNGLNVQGAEQLKNTNGMQRSVTLQANASQATNFRCYLDGQEVQCSDGMYVLNTGTLPQGSHTFVMTGYSNGQVVGETAIPFCLGNACASDGYADAAAGTDTPRGLGQYFRFQIMPGMHLYSYSTIYSIDGALRYTLKAIPGSPTMGCPGSPLLGESYTVVPLRAPSGDTYQYCYGSMTRARWKQSNDARLANNHIEVMSEPTNPVESFMLVQAYDSNYEFMAEKGLFRLHCDNRQKMAVGDMELFQDFVWGYATGKMYQCNAYTSVGPGGELQRWKVAGVFIAQGEGNTPAQLPSDLIGRDVDCRTHKCQSFTYQKAIEIVYMERLNGQNGFPEDFFLNAQRVIQQTIFKHSML